MIIDLMADKFPGHDTSGKVGKINKKAGDTLKTGDTIFSVESGKGSIKYLSKYDGVLTELYISEGDTIKKGQIIGEASKQASGQQQKKAGYSFGITKPAQKNYEVDVAVVGGGPGGYVSAIRAAQNGKKVLLIEENRLGGTCLNHGCIPTKALLSSVDALEKIKNAESFGVEVKGVKASLEKIMQRKDDVVDTLVSGIGHLMDSNQIEVIKGRAVVRDNATLTIQNKSVDALIKFEKLIIAAGSKSMSLPIEGADRDDILTSQELLSLSEVPESLTIIGGGVIGMEFAFIYSSLGSKVNVVEFFPQILNNMDGDVADIVRESAVLRGIKLYEGAKAESIKTASDGTKIVEICKNEETKYIVSDKVAVAVGRRANLDSLDFDMLGVELNEKRNGIMVDEHMATSNPDIYAIGDITNKIQLAHVASHQGIVAADNICGKDSRMDYEQVPGAIFTMPEIGHAGMNEKDAKKKGIEYLIGKFPLAANGKAQAMGETEGFVKLLADKETRKIIGGTIVGVHATDMLSTVSNIIAGGMTMDNAARVIYAHPTTAESIHEALLGLDGKGIHFA
ncbi:MAG: dihydrolipoyl dehydrogenase [Clostridiaceae bacterium]